MSFEYVDQRVADRPGQDGAAVEGRVLERGGGGASALGRQSAGSSVCGPHVVRHAVVGDALRQCSAIAIAIAIAVAGSMRTVGSPYMSWGLT